jgi:hypothetical protein
LALYQQQDVPPERHDSDTGTAAEEQATDPAPDAPPDRRPSDMVFICYRQADTGHFADRLSEELGATIGAERIFLDNISIEPGRRWRSQIAEAIDRSAVMLVLIGPWWLEAKDRNDTRLLDRPDDVLCAEIAEGLQRGEASVCVIPVLDNRSMPDESELPERIKDLAGLQGMTVYRGPRGRSDREFVVKRVAAELARRRPQAMM